MRLGLIGDTMLGRGVAERLRDDPSTIFADGVAEMVAEADVVVANLECCISERGRRWPDPDKPFFFRAPPVAADTLRALGVDCVTLANNHALDFGAEALLDTFRHLDRVGIAWVGAGPDRDRAREPVILTDGNIRLAVIAMTDHPADFAAEPHRPGVAYADLRADGIDWVVDAIRGADADLVLVTPHWGPNMVRRPVAHVRRAAAELVAVGADLVAGHSAHVFHGVEGRVLYDLGDFVDDYAVDGLLRNDLGLFFLVTLDAGGPTRIEAMPVALDFGHTRPANRAEADWIADRFIAACAEHSTGVRRDRDRLVIDLVGEGSTAPSAQWPDHPAQG